MENTKIVIDLNELFPAKANPQTVQEKVKQWDVSLYKNKSVQMKGCSPTWAHLLVAAKLIGTAASIEFLLDDGRGGQPIPIYPPQN